jgi:DNA-binding transcriptional regulator YiaG
MLIDRKSVFHLSRPMTAFEFATIRNKLDLSGAALAVMLRIGERTIRRYEMGHTEVPGPAAVVMRLMNK